MKKGLVFLLVFAVAGGAIYFAYTRLGQKTDAKAELVLYGNVDIRDVTLAFRVPGRIDSLNFEEGDRVKKGDTVAKLDQTPFIEDLNLIKAQLSETEAVLNNAEKIFERRKKLLTTKAVAQADYDDALAARDEALARRETARAKLAQAVTSLGDTELVAPTDGVMLTRVREPGSIVAVGTPVYSLALDNPVWVRTYIDEPSLGKIYPGQKALVFTSSGARYEGQVGFISPQAEFTPKNVETAQLRTDLVYRLRVIVDHPDNGLRQGMPVTVQLAR